MLPSSAAIGSHDGLVCKDRGEFTVIVLNIIRTKQRALAVERYSQTIWDIRSRVVDKDIMHAKDPSIFIKSSLRFMDLSALMCGSDKIFGAIFNPFDGAIQLHRRPRDKHFFLIEHHNFWTKSPADKWRDNP